MRGTECIGETRDTGSGKERGETCDTGSGKERGKSKGAPTQASGRDSIRACLACIPRVTA